MFFPEGAVWVHLYGQPVNMRRSFDGLYALTRNQLERTLRVIAMGRRNWLFCWTEMGAKQVGINQSLITTCRLHDIDPYTYLLDVLQRVSQHPASQVAQHTPRLWRQHFADNPLLSDLDRITGK